MKIDKRVERNTISVLALKDLLNDIIANPVNFIEQPDVIEALKSKGAMSKFSDDQRNIVGTSRNTIKRISKNTLPEGFETLEILRNTALEAIETHLSKKNHSNKVTKAGLNKRVNELEQIIQQKDEDLLCVTLALEKSLSDGRRYANKADKPSLAALCRKEQREIRIMMSLLKMPIQDKDREIVTTLKTL